VASTPLPLKRDPLEAIRAAFGTADLRRLRFGWAASRRAVGYEAEPEPAVRGA
jgi:hypothetical protein